MSRYLVCFFLLISSSVFSQKIIGTVYTDNGDLLPYASITIKGTTLGTSANSKGVFLLPVTEGKYIVMCHHIGYAYKEQEVLVVENETVEISFVLSRQKYVLKEVVVNSKSEDPAYAIIRNAISKRVYHNNQVGSFKSDLYSKNILRLTDMPDKIFGKKIPNDTTASWLDSNKNGIIFLSETLSDLYYKKPDKFKLNVKSSRISGSNSFGFTFPTYINFYQNNVTVFSERLNPRGFISPISDNAFNYYLFRFVGSFYENGREVNSILVIPKRKYEPLFSGVINIMEDSWNIHSTQLKLTKYAQLEILDTLAVNQLYVPANDSVWLMKNQLIHLSLNQMGVGIAGDFVNVFSKYELHPKDLSKVFNNVIIQYTDSSINRKDSFWNNNRPIPLEIEEAKNYTIRDSLFEVNQQKQILADSTRKQKIKFTDILINGFRSKKQTSLLHKKWEFAPLIGGLEYNTAETVVMNMNGSIQMQRAKKSVMIEPKFRYGFGNRHLNPSVTIQFENKGFVSENKLARKSLSVSFGKRVTQFNAESPITPFVNSFSTLLYGDNFMKTYENIFTSVTYNRRLEIGFQFSIQSLIEDRMPLDNISDYTFFEVNRKNITPNYPFEKLNAQFERHTALILKLGASYQPGLKYIVFPDRKISIGSKYPTFSVEYTKGIDGILNSAVNFDKWKFNITGDKNLKIAGLLKYKLSTGGFINANKVFLQDYQHFNGNLSILASEYLNSFQVSSYYANSTIEPLYFIGHFEHHFNGLLTNKIPLLKKWNWNLVAGGNTFYVNSTNNHIEFFVGLENIFKIFRVDVVRSYNTKSVSETAIRIGFSGLFSNMVKSTTSRSVTVGL